MNNWEDFIWLISNPYFIGLLLLTLAIKPILKYIRPFYSDSQKKAVEQSENFIQELQNNKEDKKIYAKANMKIMFFMFGPTFLLFAIYIAYDLYTGIELTPQCVKNAFSKSAIIGIVAIGLYAIKTDEIHRWLFKNDYKRVMDLTYKQSGGEANYKYYTKYFSIAGYFFLILGLVQFINIFFFN